MVFSPRIRKKRNMLAPENMGLAPELLLVLSTPAASRPKRQYSYNLNDNLYFTSRILLSEVGIFL
jgi:hypothetical protein